MKLLDKKSDSDNCLVSTLRWNVVFLFFQITNVEIRNLLLLLCFVHGRYGRAVLREWPKFNGKPPGQPGGGHRLFSHLSLGRGGGRGSDSF